MAEVSRILVVDDDPDIREVLRLLLSETYMVALAPDGLAAITYMKENPDTDLVVLDVMMPGLDGIETCARLREFSTAPVLFLTAKSAERDRVSASPRRSCWPRSALSCAATSSIGASPQRC